MVLYKNNYLFIFNNDNLFERNIWVIKDGGIYLRCIDYFDDINLNNPVFKRAYENNSYWVFINSLDKKILYFEKPIRSKVISSNKIDLIQDTKISTFDIETYKGKDNIFQPYSCGF